MKTHFAFLCVIALLFCVARFFMEPTHVSPASSYQAFAHLFVGGLLGGWMTTRRRDLLGLAVAMSVVEVIAAVVTRL